MEIDLDWQTYYDAAKELHTLADEIGNVLHPLRNTLQGCERMAGDSAETIEWINHYDRHAADLISTTMTMANALARYGDVLAASGYNLGVANKSTPPPDRPTPVGSIFDSKERPPPPTAKGDNGSGVETTVAGLLQALGKIPNGNTEKLGNAADAWKNFAQHNTITGAPARIRAVIDKFDGKHPNLEDILGNLNTLHDGAQGIGQGTLAIGTPVADYNSALGEMRADIHDEVIKAELELTVVLGLAVAFGIFAGAGAVAGGVAGGGIITSAVTLIRATILRSRILRIVGFIGGIATAAAAAEAFKPIPDLGFQSALAAIAAITVKIVKDGDKPSGTASSANTPGTEEYQRRVDELAKDPAHGGKITDKSRREAEVALGMEHNGQLAGPVTRALRCRKDFGQRYLLIFRLPDSVRTTRTLPRWACDSQFRNGFGSDCIAARCS
jgi:hypothetical protein